ncbi:MAG: methyltransferase family protein [Gammaproteobacteria bacterium]
MTWAVWAIYWMAVGRARLKPVEQRESRLERLSHIIPIVVAIILFNLPPALSGILSRPFLKWTFINYWIGYGVTVVALLFTVYARHYLGGNWSGTVTLKRDHTLIQAGPYRWIRHPIYTGLIGALAGSAFASARWQGLLAFAIILVTLIVKLRREERWMGEHFGVAYADYRRRSWALFPWIY